MAVLPLPMAVSTSRVIRAISFLLLSLIIAIMAGCGGTTSSFTASPAGGGTPQGGGSTGGTPASSVSAVTAPSTSIASGSTSSASVTLNAVAPTGGAEVSLTSSNSSAASVPATVTVAAGQSAANFTVTTGTVSADTSVQITAAYNNTLAGFTMTVRAPSTPPPPPPGSGVALTLSPMSVSLVAGAKQLFTATVTGSSNTAVTWTASVGAIAYNGFFTSPSVTTTTTMTVTATSQADPTVSKTAQVTVTPVPPPSGSGYSGTGPVASWKAYQYKDTDGLYHQAIKITGATTPYPVIGYSYSGAGCTMLGDKFNDFWQPLGNGLWWFINRAELVYVKWVWYDNPQNKNILQQTPCIDYSTAPKYN